MDKRFENIERKERNLNKRQSQIDRRANEMEKMNEERLAELERISIMSREEAKDLLLVTVEAETRQDMVRVLRQVEADVKEEADRKARKIVTLAMQRIASDQVSETTVRDVHSHMFWAFGVDIFNDANAVLLKDLFVQNITSYTDSSVPVAMPKGPMAIGVHTTTAAEKPVLLGELDIQDVAAGMVGVAARTLYEDSPIEACVSDANFYGLA